MTRINILVFIWSIALTLICHAGGSFAQSRCLEAKVGVCFEEYIEISSTVSIDNNFYSVAKRHTGDFELIRFSELGELISKLSLGKPEWLTDKHGTTGTVNALAADDNSGFLLAGSAIVDVDGSELQTGLLAYVTSDGEFYWYPPIYPEPEIVTIFYSAIYDHLADRFIVTGRKANIEHTENCKNWSQGLLMSFDPFEGVMPNLHLVRPIGVSSVNRMAIYDIVEGEKGSGFVAVGFQSAEHASGQGCQDDMIMIRVIHDSIGQISIEEQTTAGADDVDEIAFSASNAGNGDYILVGGGQENRTKISGMIITKMNFDSREPEMRLHPYPEDLSDQDGGDRLRVAVGTTTSNEFFVAGSVSAARKKPNQGIWRWVSNDNLTPKSGGYLTRKSGSDILDAAMGENGNVFAVGKHKIKDKVIGWSGVIEKKTRSSQFSKRAIDQALSELSNETLAVGSLNLGDKLLHEDTELAFRGPEMRAGDVLEFKVGVTENRNFGAFALASQGDLDLMITDSRENILALSTNTGHVGDYVSANLDPGKYKIILIPNVDTGPFEVQLFESTEIENTIENVFASLDHDKRIRLVDSLAFAGYDVATIPAIMLDSDVMRSTVSYYFTVSSEFQSKSIRKFVQGLAAVPQ